MTVTETWDDIGAIFDGGHGDDQLDQLRLAQPLFAITRTRKGWTATPAWTTDGRIEANTAAELSAQMTQMAAEYRVSLLTRGQDGWQ